MNKAETATQVTADFDELVQSMGWRRFLEQVITPFIRRTQAELISSESLDPPSRLSKVKLLKELGRLLSEPYTLSNHIPPNFSPKD
jgi:hypothetical protein